MRSLKLKHSRQYYINKAEYNRFTNKQAAYQIQLYNDNLVDDMVENQNNVEVINNQSMLFADLTALNKPIVYANYSSIMNSSLINNNQFQQMLIRNKANEDLNKIVEQEVTRISDNLRYVEQVLGKYNIPVDFYQRQMRKQQKTGRVHRKELLESIAMQADKVSRSEGLNIPKPFSYRNPDVMAENLLREQKMVSENNIVLEKNRLSVANGGEEIYTMKEWVWTGRGQTTRHRSNNGQVVSINDKFLIRNDKTGALDYMRYPHDPIGSFSNSGICYCECRYF